MPASADGRPSSITSYDVVLTVGADGALGVTETIAYDFGTNQKHGIFRAIPTKVPFDNDNFRLYRLSDVRVTSPDGAPTDVSRSEAAGVTTLRIGDPDKTVTGRHTYVLSYTVDGALNSFPDRVELYWNAIGTEWSVPIGAATVRVVAPAALTGRSASPGWPAAVQPCTSTTGDRHQACRRLHASRRAVAVQRLHDRRRAAERRRAVTQFRSCEERWSLKKALTPTPLTGALAGAVLLLGAGTVMYLVGTRDATGASSARPRDWCPPPGRRRPTSGCRWSREPRSPSRSRRRKGCVLGRSAPLSTSGPTSST